jgi:hypothetical protein
MRLKALLIAAVAALLAVSVAVAAPPPGKGKPATTPPTGKGKPTTGAGCKPQVTVVLRGTVTNVAGTTLTMSVTHGNRWARPWVTAGTANVTLDPLMTKVRRNGQKALTDLLSTDWLLVQARACKEDLMQSVLPTLTAVRVVAHPAKT